jgi:hypothetical protein
MILGLEERPSRTSRENDREKREAVSLIFKIGHFSGILVIFHFKYFFAYSPKIIALSILFISRKFILCYNDLIIKVFAFNSSIPHNKPLDKIFLVKKNLVL